MVAGLLGQPLRRLAGRMPATSFAVHGGVLTLCATFHTRIAHTRVSWVQPTRLQTRSVCANLRLLSTASRHSIARLCAILFTMAQCEGASISEERGTSEERNITAHGVTLKLHGHSADTRHIG